MWELVQISGDDDYGREKAWPVLRDVARWVCSRGQWREEGAAGVRHFDLNHTMGER
jgi:trehalose/maltose hydrolase-like predicted phosphorylase